VFFTTSWTRDSTAAFEIKARRLEAHLVQRSHCRRTPKSDGVFFTLTLLLLIPSAQDSALGNHQATRQKSSTPAP